MKAEKDKNTGKWLIQFRYTNWQGERKKTTKRGFNTKREAEEWVRNFLMSQQADFNMNFEEFVKIYRADVENRIRLSTGETKDNIIDKKILPYFGKKSVNSITAADIRNWQNIMMSLRKKDGKPYSETYLHTINNQLTAKYKMHQTKLRYGKMDGIVAFHAIQSFKPGETTPDRAHEIGIKLAKEMWGDRFEVVIATHLNKEHLHNHFVINSVSFVDGKKYYDNTANYNKMKRISDRLCEEYNLSVIRNPKSKGKHYAEWYAEKNGYPTIRGQIRDEIDGIIEGSYTTQSFWNELKRRGYEVKNTGKYIAVKATFAQKYVRLDNLGKYYTPDAINERIIAARNGIKLIEINKPKPDYNAWLEKYEPIKLKGFKALYYHYLYLFGKIRKRETPQRVCFYLREELIKFERYQKQFHFLYDNDIETSAQLLEIKQSAECRISELTLQRSRLYHKPEAKGEIADINTELKELRAKVRMCNNILTDSERINEKYNEAQRLEQEAMVPQKHKKKDKEITR